MSTMLSVRNRKRKMPLWKMRDRLLLDSKPGWFFSGPAAANNELPPANGSSWGITVPKDAPIVLPGAPGRISLTSITELTNGTLGWAASWDGGLLAQPQEFGRIYVYGVMVQVLCSISPEGQLRPSLSLLFQRFTFFATASRSPNCSAKSEGSSSASKRAVSKGEVIKAELHKQIRSQGVEAGDTH